MRTKTDNLTADSVTETSSSLLNTPRRTQVAGKRKTVESHSKRLGINWNLAVSQSNSTEVLCHVTLSSFECARVSRWSGLEMAVRRQERERSRSTQPTEEDSENERESESPVESSVSSKLYATLFIVPGIVLYVYMLYIVLANLLYPSSLAPFMPNNSSANSTTKGGVCLYRVAQCIHAH